MDKAAGEPWSGIVIYDRDISRVAEDGWARRAVSVTDNGKKERFTITGRSDPVPPGAKLSVSGVWMPAKGNYPPDLKCDAIDVATNLEEEARDAYLGYLVGLPREAVADLRSEYMGDLETVYDSLDDLVMAGQVTAEVSRTWREVWAAGRQGELDFAGRAGKAGLTAAEVDQLFAVLGDGTEAAVAANPYQVMRVPGVDFRRADLLARDLGMKGEAEPRMDALVLQAMANDRSRGSTASVFAEVVGGVDRLDQSVSIEAIGDAVGRLEDRKEVDVVEFDQDIIVQWRPTRRVEHTIASQISGLLVDGVRYPRDMIERQLEFVLDRERRQGSQVTLNEKQREAVIGASSNPVSIVYGGGGTGKSTISRFAMEISMMNGETARRVAPTATAAERLGEVTEGLPFQHPEQTMHLFLGARADGTFKLGPKNKVAPRSSIFADEFSLVPAELAAPFFSAVGPSSRVIMTMDPNQLGSVGEGAVGRDLIRSGLVPAFKLEGGFRTSEDSGMAVFGAAVLRGEMPDLPEGAPRGGILFIPTAERDAPDVVVELVRRELEAWRQFKVLSPTRELLGRINGAVQQAVNPDGEAIRRLTPDAKDPLMRVVPRLGDFVRHAGSNIYDRSDEGDGVLVPRVLNGHTGWIKAVTPAGVETVMGRAEKPVLYRPSELGQLVTAYGGTVHEAQGCQYQKTILVLGDEGGPLANQQMLYTGTSRWRQLLIVVAQRAVIEMYLKNAGAEQRRTLLEERLQHCVDYRLGRMSGDAKHADAGRRDRDAAAAAA